jgi:hypothetical protein
MEDDMFAELTKEGPLSGPKEVVYKNETILQTAGMVPLTTVPMTPAPMRPMGSPLAMNYNMEAAQVMVMVPKPAPTFFDKLKTGFMIFGLLVVCYAIVWMYMKIKRWTTSSYEGTPLPGPLVQSTKDVARSVHTDTTNNVEPQRILEQPIVHVPSIEAPAEDLSSFTVYLQGAPPVWEDPEEPQDTYEARVDENNPAVNAILQSRESFNKQLEEHLAVAMKQQQKH